MNKRQAKITLLRKEREINGWSLTSLHTRLCELIDDPKREPISIRQVASWERSEHLPGPYWLELLCRVYEKSPLELGLVREESLPEQQLSSPEVGSLQKACDWGEAPDVSTFFGRKQELLTLEKWITEDRCRLITIVGMKGIGKTRLSVKLGKGGIGKTDLSLRLARGIQEQFTYVIWRRLLNAPHISEVLADLIKFLSDQKEVHMPETVSGRISRLLHYLHQYRVLVILDNVETILQGGKEGNQYSPGYKEYGQLFEHIAEVPHQSCLLLTSREKIPEIARIENETGPVRSLELKGLHPSDGRQIFAEIGSFVGLEEDWLQLNNLYGGNPLALGLAARHIKEVFFGNIAEFLRDGKPIFGDLRGLLDWHFHRLSDPHKEVMYWLAINREPTSLSELQEDILSLAGKERIASTLHSLQRLIPLEKSARRFTIQPVLIEYMTEQFVDHMVEEVRNGTIHLFNTHALLKTSVSDYVRDIQRRIILKPIIEKLLEIYGNQEMLEQRLKEILELLHENFHLKPGYAGGNLLNMLCFSNVDLGGYDFSSLVLWHAYLQEVELPEVNFAHAHFFKPAFAETFGIIFSVTFSPKGDLLAAGTSYGEIQLWQTANGVPVLACKKHADQVRSVAFSPDGNILASGSEDQTVRLWEVSTGRCLRVLQGYIGRVWSVAFSPDGSTLASAWNDRTVRIWEVSTGQCIQIFQGHTDWVRSVVFSPDGNILASACEDQTVRIWEVSTGACLHILQGHISRVYSVAFSPNGKSLVSGSQDQTVRLWEVNTGQCLHVLHGHTDQVLSVAFSPDGKTVASGNRDLTVRLWEVNTGRCLCVLQGHTSCIFAVAFGADGKTVASGSQDQTVRLWEVSTGRSLKTLRSYTSSVYSVTFNPDGNILASGNRDLTVRLWEVSTGQCIQIFQGHTDWVRSVAFSPDGKTVASGSEDLTVRLWATSTGHCLKILRGHTDLLRSVAFSPDGNILASACEDLTIRLWEISTGQCFKILQEHTGRVWSVAFSPDGSILASASDDLTVRLWEVSTGRCLHILQGHTDWVRSVAFSPDGSTISSGSQDQTARLWEVNTGQCLSVLQGHTDWVRSVAFSPDGIILASGSQDQTVRLWGVSTGQGLRILRGHTDGVFSVAFSHGQDAFASGSNDGTVKLWDPQTGECLKTLRSDRPYERMNITEVQGLTEAQKAILTALGATEDGAASKAE